MIHELIDQARNLGHDMKEPREAGQGLYSLCRSCGRSAWTVPDLRGGHGTAVTHQCSNG